MLRPVSLVGALYPIQRLARMIHEGSCESVEHWIFCDVYLICNDPPQSFNPVPHASRTSIHAEIDDDLLTAFSVERKRLPVSLVRQYMFTRRDHCSRPLFPLIDLA